MKTKKEVKETLKQLQDEGVISEGEYNRMWNDYLSMDKALKPHKEA